MIPCGAQSRHPRDRFTSSIEAGQEAAYLFELHKSDLASVYCQNGVSFLIASKERFEDVLCTDDGNGAAVGCKVMGRSACSIAVQALNVLKVGRSLPLCQIERMLSSTTSASGLHIDILKSCM